LQKTTSLPASFDFGSICTSFLFVDGRFAMPPLSFSRVCRYCSGCSQDRRDDMAERGAYMRFLLLSGGLVEVDGSNLVSSTLLADVLGFIELSTITTSSSRNIGHLDSNCGLNVFIERRER
uniref:Secreted protein n=1 Tax=Haemonchus placei TaxID=6290 RepID=A0A0N4WS17_HAEPC